MSNDQEILVEIAELQKAQEMLTEQDYKIAQETMKIRNYKVEIEQQIKELDGRLEENVIKANKLKDIEDRKNKIHAKLDIANEEIRMYGKEIREIDKEKCPIIGHNFGRIFSYSISLGTKKECCRCGAKDT
jgi:DNA repair exonuclease SbcCD ATPase subunit